MAGSLVPGRGPPQAPHFECESSQLNKHTSQCHFADTAGLTGAPTNGAAPSSSFAVFGDESFELWLDGFETVDTVSADVCGLDSFTSSATSSLSDSSDSDSLLLLSEVCFSTDSALLSLSTSLDSDERTELAILATFVVPTAGAISTGALKENARLSRNPCFKVDPGASFKGCGFERVASGRGGSFCESSPSSSISSLSLNVFRLTGFPSGPFKIETCGFLMLEEFIDVVEAADIELAVFFGAGGSNENTELSSVDARVPLSDFKEFVSEETLSPFFELVRFLVKSVQ